LTESKLVWYATAKFSEVVWWFF